MAVREFKIRFYNLFVITMIRFNKGPFGPFFISIRHFKNNKEIKEIREFRESKEKLTNLTNLPNLSNLPNLPNFELQKKECAPKNTLLRYLYDEEITSSSSFY